MSASLVSVIIPTYNRSAAIDRTVCSVLQQDIEADGLEVIIVDDGSTDDTWEVLQELYGADKRVRLFRIPNGGVAKARNFGLEQARGEFVAFLDHDDLWLPQKLRLQRDKMRKNPKAGMVYCNWLAVNEQGEPMPKVLQHPQQYWWRPKQGNAYPWVLMPHSLEFLRNPISSMSYPMIRTQLLRDLGGFDEATVPSDDWDLWIRLSKVTRFAYVPKVLVHYVHHEGQQHMNLEKAYRSWLKICAKHPVNIHEYPFVWFKQQLFIRYCVALLNYPKAEAAAERKDYRLMLLYTFKAGLNRPDTLLYRRWVKLFLHAGQQLFKPK